MVSKETEHLNQVSQGNRKQRNWKTGLATCGKTNEDYRQLSDKRNENRKSFIPRHQKPTDKSLETQERQSQNHPSHAEVHRLEHKLEASWSHQGPEAIADCKLAEARSTSFCKRIKRQPGDWNRPKPIPVEGQEWPGNERVDERWVDRFAMPYGIGTKGQRQFWAPNCQSRHWEKLETRDKP